MDQLRVLFSSLGTHGHTYPLLPLAVAALAQGHEVTYATGESLHPPLARLGFDVVTAGKDIGEAFGIVASRRGVTAGRDSLPPDELLSVLTEVFGSVIPRAFIEDLRPVVDRLRPDLVVHELGNPGAGIAAGLADVPALCHGFGRMAPAEFTKTVAWQLEEVAAEFGLDLPTGNPFLLGNLYLDICPPTFQDPDFLTTKSRVELRPVPFAEPGELPAWVREHDRPLVYLTLGTAFGTIPVLREAIDGLAALDVRVLVAAGPQLDVAELGDVPDNVAVENWVPQADLLPFADLVVHHGGSGTTLGALGAGVPQLILPQGADQFTNAEAVLGVGAGDRLLGEEVTGEAVRAKAKRLLGDDAVHEVCRAFAVETAGMPSPEEVARRLPEFTR